MYILINKGEILRAWFIPCTPLTQALYEASAYIHKIESDYNFDSLGKPNQAENYSKYT